MKRGMSEEGTGREEREKKKKRKADASSNIELCVTDKPETGSCFISSGFRPRPALLESGSDARRLH